MLGFFASTVDSLPSNDYDKYDIGLIFEVSMDDRREINRLVNIYCRLRDRQRAVYDRCAKRHGLTVNELFVLDILWFSSEGCTQKELCWRLSTNKQTIAAIAGKFLKNGYITFEEVEKDRRCKRIRFTQKGLQYAGEVIPAAARAENIAMAKLNVTTAAELRLPFGCSCSFYGIPFP